MNTRRLIYFLQQNKKTLLALFISFLFVESFFKETNSDFILFSSLFAYFVFVKVFRINSRVTFSLCLILLIGMSFSYLFIDKTFPTEKMAVWMILFLFIGMIQQWKE